MGNAKRRSEDDAKSGGGESERHDDVVRRLGCASGLGSEEVAKYAKEMPSRDAARNARHDAEKWQGVLTALTGQAKYFGDTMHEYPHQHQG